MIKDLILGDCMEVMKGLSDQSVDIIVTSPPYNLAKKASGGGNSKVDVYKNFYPDEMDEMEYQLWQENFLRECIRVCKGSVFYNHRVRYAWHTRNKYRTASNLYHPWDWVGKFPVWSEIIWWRKMTSGHPNNRFRLADERIYQIGKPHYFKDMGYTTVWEALPTKNHVHPCSFPEEIPKRCLETFCPPGGVLMDPFMGSGTSVLVAEKMGYQYIGIEKDPSYFEYAKSRLKADHT